MKICLETLAALNQTDQRLKKELSTVTQKIVVIETTMDVFQKARRVLKKKLKRLEAQTFALNKRIVYETTQLRAKKKLEETLKNSDK